MEEFLYKDEGYQILGACFEVYKAKGCGFVEPVYQECLELEFALRNIPFQSQPEVAIFYKGVPLKKKFVPDFICYGKIIVELKAVSTLTDEHRAQILNYLKATGYHVGYLVNFAHYPKIQHERFVLQ
ncbi:MAG TPA: GxxExxY protein [Kiritimatiellia bacterium]|nr:GxxExxY protein [Kiritimatiellia bacterium]